MAPHRYTSAELLELRHSALRPGLENAVAKLARNPELVDLLKKPYTEPIASHNRRSRTTKEGTATSNDSDEQILFKGKKSTQVESDASTWQYLGRSGSDLTSGDPISAPAGLAAQQSEGFKRFYKAVVSPSHLRVTAGGRIVPNTRPSASPTAKWDKVSLPSERGEPSEPSLHGHKYNTAGPANPMMMPPAGMYGPMLQYPPMMAPMPLAMPLFQLPNGYPFAYGNPPFANIAQPMAAQVMHPQVQRDHGNTGAGPSQNNVNADSESPKRDGPPPALAMPNDGAELGRPFMYDGRLMYQQPFAGFMQTPYLPAPPPPQHTFYASGNYRPPQLSCGPPAPPPPGPLGASSRERQSRAQIISREPSSRGPSRTTDTPPVSSIRPSSVTKRQLDTLRASLKFYEDQLAYNKHQIDEASTQEQARKIRSSIAQFEQNLRMQEEFEADHYPKHTSESEASGSTPSERMQQQQSFHDAHLASGGSHTGPFTPHAASSNYRSRHPRSEDYLSSRPDKTSSGHLRGSSTNRTSETLGSSSDTFDTTETASKQSAAGTSNAVLPRAAALAQPFSSGMGLPYSHRPFLNQHLQPSREGHFRHGPLQPTHPYLVGSLSQQSLQTSTRAGIFEYNYPRELTPEERRAREVYWGNGPSRGTGLPKFDGKDFYPPSPVKSSSPENTFDDESSSVAAPTGECARRRENVAPVSVAQPTHDTASTARSKSGRRLSHAIPIVAPPGSVDNFNDGTAKVHPQRADAGEVLPPAPVVQQGHQVSERSSNRSAIGLWHNMMKNGSTGGHATPGTINSTAATGYLPQYAGHAAASLMPSAPNTSSVGSLPSCDKPASSTTLTQTHERTGENCPPGSTAV